MAGVASELQSSSGRTILEDLRELGAEPVVSSRGMGAGVVTERISSPVEGKEEQIVYHRAEQEEQEQEGTHQQTMLAVPSTDDSVSLSMCQVIRQAGHDRSEEGLAAKTCARGDRWSVAVNESSFGGSNDGSVRDQAASCGTRAGQRGRKAKLVQQLSLYLEWAL